MADWAEKVEIAMSLDDEEANQIRRNAEATGDPQKVAAANAYIANLWSLAKQSGCKTISGCNNSQINDLRNIWKDTQGMNPIEQLNLQNRIATNIYQLGRYFPKDLTPMLNELAQNARKNRGKNITANDLWGNAGGVTFFNDQWNGEMKGVQGSILRGGMTAKQWRDLANSDKGLGAILQGFAKFALAGLSDEDWREIADLLMRGGLIVLLTAGGGLLLASLVGLLMSTGMSAVGIGILKGISVLLQQFGLNYALALTIQGVANLSCGKSFADNFNGNSQSAAATAFGASFLGTLPAAFTGISKSPKGAEIFGAILKVAKTSPTAALPGGLTILTGIVENNREGCGG